MWCFSKKPTSWIRRLNNFILDGWGMSYCGSSLNLINKQVQFKCLAITQDDLGRMLMMLVEIQGLTVILVNVYAPNRDNLSFFGVVESK